MTNDATVRVLLLAALPMLMWGPGAAQTTNFETLYSFQGSPDGAMPAAGLALTATGVLYGTTSGGGASGEGTVFAVMR